MQFYLLWREIDNYKLDMKNILEYHILTFKKTKPTKDSTICDHFLECNNIPSFEEFTILAKLNNKLIN